MTNNTQLPANLAAEVNQFVADKTKAEREHLEGRYNSEFKGIYTAGYEYGVRTGATEYANKLHQAEQEIERLKGELDVAIRANDNLTSRMVSWQQQLYGLQKDRDTARTLLQKFISRHEAGLLPDRFIYQEIKTFLDGK